MNEQSSSSPYRVTTRQVHVALTIAGASGIVMSGLPFAFDYVPIRDAFPGGFLEPSWWGVLPCMLLPVLIFAGYGLWLKRGFLPRWCSTWAYILAALSVGPFFASMTLDFAFDGYDGMIFPALFVVAFCAAAGLVVQRTARERNLTGLLAMQAVFVVQIQFWLALAAENFQAGAWLATAAAIAYVTQIMLISRARAWLLLLLLAPAPVLTIVIVLQA